MKYPGLNGEILECDIGFIPEGLVNMSVNNSINDDEFQCGCPSCRMGRGELTPNEYAWYLKGCIESRAKDIQAYKQGKYGEPDPDKGILFKSYENELSSVLTDDECILNMMIDDFVLGTHEFSNKLKLKKLDKAFLTPRDHICEACVKHGKRLPNNV